MKKSINLVMGMAALAVSSVVMLQVGCASDTEEKTTPQTEQTSTESTDPVSRGRYLTTTGGCNDCHSPKIFGPQGMGFDTTRLLSGHPAGDPLPPVDKKALQPGYWVMFSGGLTAAVGPWGISYAANLTPDSATGIGAWREVDFINSMRTGKHMGHENGRPILPPMPWQQVAKFTDSDLKAIYAYLRTLQPISNRVPNPVPPNEITD